MLLKAGKPNNSMRNQGVKKPNQALKFNKFKPNTLRIRNSKGREGGLSPAKYMLAKSHSKIKVFINKLYFPI